MITRRLFTGLLAGTLMPGCLACLNHAVAADQTTVYVGTYTGKQSKGIYAFDFDTTTGKAGELRLVAEVASPSFLAMHPKGNVLYSVNELNEFDGRKGGGLSAFRIGNGGELTLLNQVSTLGGGPCHLTIDPAGKAVLVANYGGGSVISYQLESDGRIGAQASFVQHEGSSVNPNRQKAPHAHGIYLDQAARFAFVPDLGMDKVLVYRFDATTGKLTPNDPAGVAIEPGSGPRHFALHPTKPLAWSLNEMVSTITSLKYDPVRGTLEPTTTVSTLPAGPVAGNSTAEIFVHPNGKFLYASNRGHDSIAVFQIDGEAGALTPVQHEPIAGRTPRSFVLDAGGRWLLAAGQSSDTIAIFRLDPETGRITRTGNPMTAPTPVCLVFAAR